MRTLVKAKKRITAPNGTITYGSSQYKLIDVGGTCIQDRQTYNSLSPEAKAALDTTQPATTTSWLLRTCIELETQPVILVAYPDMPFTTAGIHTITVPKANYAGGNLVFTATTGTATILEGDITMTIVGDNIVFTIPSTTAGEWYIIHLVATNSVGSVDDAFAVHLIYNAIEVEAPNSGYHGDTGGGGGGDPVVVVPPAANDPSSYKTTKTFNS